MEVQVGRVSHYFSHLEVAGIELTGELKVGDRIRIKGHTTDLVQPVNSIEIEHHKVDKAGPGDSIGIKVTDHVREHDAVFVVPPGETTN